MDELLEQFELLVRSWKELNEEVDTYNASIIANDLARKIDYHLTQINELLDSGVVIDAETGRR